MLDEVLRHASRGRRKVSTFLVFDKTICPEFLCRVLLWEILERKINQNEDAELIWSSSSEVVFILKSWRLLLWDVQGKVESNSSFRLKLTIKLIIHQKKPEAEATIAFHTNRQWERGKPFSTQSWRIELGQTWSERGRKKIAKQNIGEQSA